MPMKNQAFSSFSLLNLANEEIESTAAKIQLNDLFLDNEFFSEPWHCDNYQSTIIDDNECRITWRLKERMKTSGVALALCLNNGTDPPDVVRPPKCARKECWFDPTGAGREKGVEKIGNLLQQQYEKVQSKARYKLSLDPTPEDLRRTCLNLRKQARNERLLMHYNGHGVPRPTQNGELWAFGKHYTHYMPISIYELRNWFGDPAIYVFDCSGAAALLPHFNDTHPSFSGKDDGNIYAMFDRTMAGKSPGIEGSSNETPPTRRTSSSITDTTSLVLCACKADEILPMNPLFPADVFTSCLTTPLRIAIRWFILQNPHLSGLSVDMAENIPGKEGDRKTPRGELNWLFTAVTDTIAWNVLTPTMFQKLFRQDLLVASLFRNFLLAKRIMKSLNCNPVSIPPIPDCTSHPMWRSWDMAVESCLLQLHALQKPGGIYEAPLLNAASGASSFFTEHLNSFEVWLSFGGHGVSSNEAPIHLPILLQVLLSQSHRMKALQLLRKYLCQGPEAANSALLVGIFPYILKLLQNNDSQIRHVLIAIWTYIIGFDCSCRNELLREKCLPVFSQCMVSKDAPMKLRSMAAFVMAEMCNGYRDGQQACLQSGLHRMCHNILMHESMFTNSELRKWVILCVSRLCEEYSPAKYQCIMDDMQSSLYAMLLDPHPMVRTASVLSLGELFGAMSANSPVSTEFNREQSVTRAMELNIAVKVLETCQDGCVMVRREAVLALAKVFVSPGHNDCIKLIASHVFTVLDWDPIRDVTDRNTFTSETSRSSRVASTPKKIPTKESPSPMLDLPTFLVDSANSVELVRRLRELIVIQESQTLVPAMGESLLGQERDGRGSASPCLPPEQSSSPDEEQIIGLCSGYVRLWLGLLEVYCSEPHASVVKAVKSILRHIYSQIAIDRNSDLSLNAPDGSSIVGGWGSLPCRPNGSPTKPGTNNTSPRASLSAAAPPPPATKPNRKTLSPARFFSKHKQHFPSSPQKNSFEMRTHESGEMPALRTLGLKINVPPAQDVDDINLFSPKDVPASPWMRGVDITAEGGAITSTPQMFVDITLLSTTYDWNRKLFLRPERGYRPEDDPLTLEGQEKINRAAYRDDILDLAYRISNAFRPIEDLGRTHAADRDTFVLDDSLPESRTVISSGTSNSIDVSMLPVGATKFVCKALIPIPNSDVPSSVMFHSMHDVLAVCDGAGVDIWSLESGKNMLQIRSPSNRGAFPDNDPQQARVTSMGWINETVNSLLMTGSEDGTVRIWRDVGDVLEDRSRYSGDYMAATDSACSPCVSMVSAFTALSDIHKTSRGSGLVSSWQQSNGMLTVGGNSSTIRLWDVTREQCVRVYETKLQTCTTCIVSQSAQKSAPAHGRRNSDNEDSSPSFSWCFAGFADGSIGIFDQRVHTNGGRVVSAREHSSWIVNAFLRCDVPEVITGAVKGDVRFWDIRTMKSYKTIEVHKSPLTALSVHNVAPILATGSHAQFIKIVTFGGDQLGMIRYHDGFFGQRIGQVSCLAFHPVRMMLATGATDNIVSIYGVQDG